MLKCLESAKVRFIFFKLTLVISDSGTHANIIIFDKKRGTLERFEPYGVIPYLDSDDLDKIIKEKIGGFLEDYLKKKKKKLIYYSPRDLMGDVSFQIISNDTDMEVKKLGDPTGYCLAWTFWYLEMRIQNSSIDPKELIKFSLKKIVNAKQKYRDQIFIDFIRRYAADLDNKKNKLLLQAGVDKSNVYNLAFKHNDHKKIMHKLIQEFDKIVVERL